MKTKTSFIAGLIVALLFRAAWSLPGPADYQKTADDVKKATVTPTLKASAQTVQIPSGQSATASRVTWNVGTGRPIIVLRVNVNGSGEIDLQTLPRADGPGFNSRPTGSLAVPIKSGTNVFSLNQGGQTLASVTVIGKSSSGDSNQGPPPANTNSSKPAATASGDSSAQAEDSSANDNDDRHGKHKKNKKWKKHHHDHDDDDRNQGNE